MMKCLILDALPNKESEGNHIVSEKFRKAFKVEHIRLENESISSCLGCFGCWTKTPGVCVIDDFGRHIAESHATSDVVLWVTPIRFGGYSSALKKSLDRILPNILPYFRKIDGEVHHAQRYQKRPILVVVGVMNGDTTEAEKIAFKNLAQRNRINFDPDGIHVFITEQMDSIKAKVDESFVGQGASR
ncbi:MAG TPA: flavodoxin family protein [Caldisericia bacterium]|nr:flavodoxin family protein [Caldisericia bacterium]HPF48222.1 flavodoxin family protein [Caldisericia bacterium]HPI83842.1 flavodoxin family protein [Caldisericia bacterium]HPQ92675.1 flavodoxin family protein [Caldisericia bacterium]